jgi:hypothetical protein
MIFKLLKVKNFKQFAKTDIESITVQCFSDIQKNGFLQLYSNIKLYPNSNPEKSNLRINLPGY